MINREFLRKAALLAVIITVPTLIVAGCSEKSAEPERKTHAMGWSDPTSPNFHGAYLAERGMQEGIATCRSCHGPDSLSVTTGFSCFGCHDQYPHPANWSGSGGINEHQNYIQRKGWNLSECQTCHGADYRTTKLMPDSSLVSCYTCHTSNAGPQGCRVCHGGPNSSAPPADLLGGTSSDLITVGAHTSHIDESGTFVTISCGECHSQFAGYASPSHIDTTTPGIAEVTFGALATDSGRTNPTWDRNSGSCSSVYCHGSFDGGNTTNNVIWTAGPSQATCGTCHNLPPTSHTLPEQQQACAVCHSFTQEHHVNGVVDLR